MKPNRRELELAGAMSAPTAAPVIAELLAMYREELLRPFDELRRDAVALRDDKMATWLDELLCAARGVL